MSEQVFFDNGVVSVTSARCILRGQTIPVRSLNAVSMLQENPPKTFPIILVIIGVILLLCKVWLWGAIIAVAGAAWLYFMKKIYYVHIETSSGSSNAYGSTDKAHIQEIVDAINDAIISQAK
ncbi:MAG: hypothetical protein K2N27_01640 [Ruminococcus sp.]|nr:hypothetical protein [Ruminococcus sp.]